jgi:hypothetical protein
VTQVAQADAVSEAQAGAPAAAPSSEGPPRPCPDCREPCPDVDSYIDHRFEFHRVPAYRAVEEYEGRPGSEAREDTRMEDETESEDLGPTRTRRRGRRRRSRGGGKRVVAPTTVAAPPPPKPCWYCHQPPGSHRPTCKRQVPRGSTTPPAEPSVGPVIQEKLHRVRDELGAKRTEVARLEGKVAAYEELERELAGGPRGGRRA